MNRRRQLVFPVLGMLLLLTLGCNLPWVGTTETIDLPTAAPTPAPEDTPEPGPPQPSGEGPLVIQGQGTRFSYSADGQYSCASSVPVTLTIQPAGSAELTFTAPVIIDHINCTAAESTETFYINGASDPVSQTVTFKSCNYGGLSASGAVSYADGILSGTAVYFLKDGQKSAAIEFIR